MKNVPLEKNQLSSGLFGKKRLYLSQKFQTMMPVLLASVVFVLIAFFLFSVRLLFVKGGEFRGTCAGNSSFLKKDGIACGVCGRKPGEACGKES